MERFRRSILIYGGLILGSAVLFSTGGWWMARSIEAHAKEIALQRSLVSGRAKSLEVLARLKQNSRDVDTYGALMERLLPEREELLNFPRWMELFGRSSQIGLNFSYHSAAITPPSQGIPGSIGFNLEATGSVDKLAQFVEEVETKSKQFLVSFDSYDLKKDEGQYRLIMSGRVYFR